MLSRDQNGQLTCAKDVKRLGVTLEIGASSRKASSGFCTLWTSPSNQRQFVSKPRQP
ncbi:DUF6753 family protein [Nostoc sp. KVJ3]|uniref:DUF6753 family protein n=1 Tax=Nostoc sp. KVJ3 TaxID=457945 RepID=UPI002AA2A18B|nr:DUF6753 family protein [Nostoc sp. KVJ3]